MEAPKKTTEQTSVEKLSGKQKFDILLGLFGSAEARDRFVSICKEYYIARTKQTVQGNDGENHKPKKGVVYSPPKRAALHNKIMDTIGRIATESKNLNELQLSVLRNFASRENVAQAIKGYILAENTLEEDEDEDAIKKTTMSETAYFHSLSKGN